MVFSRKSIISCFLLLMVLTLSSPLFVYAQGAATGGANGTAPTGPGGTAPSSQPTNNTAADVGSCGFFNLKGCAAGIANIVLSFFAFVLGISAFLMNFAINYSIVDLAKNLGGITAINQTWSAIRDLINLSFIFILLFAAIRTILGLESPGKVIKNIVLAALFINFSMFFTRVMIDASNSVALFFYNRLTDNSSTGSLVIGLGSPQANSLVNAYVGPLKIQSIYNNADPTQVSVGSTNQAAVSYGTIITVGILGSFMLGLVAFVFLTIAIMFIIRYAALVLILIFSPFGFVSSELPMIGEYNKKWWGMLKSQLLFPPIFMILTWITIKVIANIGTSTGSLRGALSAAAGSQPTPSDVGLVVNFLIIMVLIIMSLTISIETAAKGSEALSGFYKKSTKWAGGAMFGTAGFIGRNTGGFIGNKFAQSETLQKAASEGRGVARLALLGANAAQKGSFDVRGSTFGGAFKDTVGIEAGKAGGQGGRAKEVADRQKKLEERGKLFEGNQQEKNEVKAQLADIAADKKPIEEEMEELNKKKTEIENSAEYKSAQQAVDATNKTMDTDLKNIDADIKAKNIELSQARASGDLIKGATIRDDLDQLNQRKTTLEEQKKRTNATLSDFGVEGISEQLRKLSEQKAAIEQNSGEKELKDKQTQIGNDEKSRKRAYAKSIKENPTVISEEFKEVSSSLDNIAKLLSDNQAKMSQAQASGNKVLTDSLKKENDRLLEEQKRLDKRRQRTGGMGGFVNKLSSVANFGVGGAFQRTGAAGLNFLGANFDPKTVGMDRGNLAAAAKIRMDLAEKPKAQQFYEKIKKEIEEDSKKDTSSAPTAIPETTGGTTPPPTTT